MVKILFETFRDLNRYKQKHIKTPFPNLLLPIKALYQQLYPMFSNSIPHSPYEPNWIPHSPYGPKVGPFDLKVGLPELQISPPEPQTSPFESK